MQTIQGFGVDIINGNVFYQCPTCNPAEPYNLGSFQKLIHMSDLDNDGLSDVSGLSWQCPNVACDTVVNVPYEDSPNHIWGVKLKEIFKQKESMFKKITMSFTGLNVAIGGSPDYLNDNFALTADGTYTKKFKVCFAVNDLSQYDVWITTQLQDGVTDWGSLPAGWTELDCIMSGLILAGATSINKSDVNHILDPIKVTGLIS